MYHKEFILDPRSSPAQMDVITGMGFSWREPERLMQWLRFGEESLVAKCLSFGVRQTDVHLDPNIASY